MFYYIKKKKMDDENKDLEDPMETGMLDDMINYNIDVWETQNELVENHQTLEENKPKKKSKLRKILFIILWVFWVLFLLRLAIVFLFLKWLSNLAEKMGSTNISMEQEDWLYEFNGHWRHNWIDSYMLTPVNSNEIVIWDDTFEMSYDDSFQNMINLSTKDYSWIEGMYNFDPYIYLDLKFSEWKIMDWSIVDIKTKKNLWQLNFDELNQIYNFEAKYPIKEIEKKNSFKLSEFDENVIYKYVLTPEDESIPWIINDLDFDVVFYKKSSSSLNPQYEPNIYFANDDSFWWFRYSSSDETIYMMYQRATKEDILYVLEPLPLGQYEHWKEIDIWSEDYLYNDTDEMLRLILIDDSFWEKETKSKKVLKPWEVYKKGSFIDYVIIK